MMQASPAEADLVVLGSGAAGLSAALRAAVSGARVVVLEKSDLVGGTSAMSGACTWLPNNHRMAEVGATDSREEALAYMRATAPAGWHNEEEPLWAAMVDEGPAMLRFVEAHTPIRFRPTREPDPYPDAPGAKAIGRNVSPRPLPLGILGPWRAKLRPSTLPHEFAYQELADTHFMAQPARMMLRLWPRLLYRRLTGRRGQGSALMAGLLRGCLDAGCTILTEAAAEELLVEGGRVVAVRYRHGEADRRIEAARGVVVATGGFEWNAAMMARWHPGPVVWTASPRTNTGDGQRMAEAVGARLDRMDQALTMGASPVTYEGREHGRPARDYNLPHAILVNRDGRRFVDEATMNTGLAFEARDPETGHPVNLPAWRIYDGQFARKYPHALPRGAMRTEYLAEAGSLRELAARVGIDADGLEAAVERFNGFARAGRDEDFGRGDSAFDRHRGGDPRHGPNPALGTIERPPFYAMPYHNAFLGTKGGPRTDAAGRVLRHDGSPIDGLFAAGNAMANPVGSKGIGAGTTIGPCLTWGWICAGTALGLTARNG